MSDRIRKGHLRQRIHIHIEGIVQGVGFRPFLHRLAEEHGICGWVRNTSAGLEGILEGETAELSLFLTELKVSPPPMAQIEAIRTENIDTSSNTAQHTGTFDRFTIRASVSVQDPLSYPLISQCAPNVKPSSMIRLTVETVIHSSTARTADPDTRS